MADNKIQMPGVFGGLMRYDSEYKSRFMLSPNAIIVFLVVIVVFVLVLKIFWPIIPGFFLPFRFPDFGFGISLIRNLGGF